MTEAVVAYAVERIKMDAPIDGPRDPEALGQAVGQTVTPTGLGGQAALRLFIDTLAPATISADHPKFLAFVPAAPTTASVLFDLIVGASSVYGGSWLEGAGAVYAENQALRWVADLAGMPERAGGVFVSGGTAGNLSALVAARHRWRSRSTPRNDRVRGAILASATAHSSIAQAGATMDADIIAVPTGLGRAMQGRALAETLAGLPDEDRDRCFAVVATSGTTNAGIVDDLLGIGQVCDAEDLWFHVDGAYGAAALAAPSVAEHFVGIDRADSLIVDPHKWLFAPYDACALIYRNPEQARAAHTQRAGYLEILHAEDPASQPWNPSDYAHHLSRRARGLPFWFSLAVNGTDAYRDAIEASLTVARAAAESIRSAGHVELLNDPQLGVLVFRRLGWNVADYRRWSDDQLNSGQSFVMPTTWGDESVLRICIVNPLTTTDHIDEVIASLA